MNNNNDIKEEIVVLPVDDCNQLKLKWTIKEYVGSSCYLLTDPNKKTIINIDGLKIGDKIVVWDSWVATITDINENKAIAETDHSIIPMEFNIDDRHCWIATGMINMRGIKKLTNE